MRAKLVAIGNSKGIRLPKALIEQCNLGEEIELEVKQGQIIIRPFARPRAGWEAAFEKLKGHGDDGLMDQETVDAETEWERAEWKW